jgi:hypothetical protein
MMKRARLGRVLTIVGSAATVLLLGFSIVRDVPRSWSAMRGEHARFVGLNRLQRDEEFGTLLPLLMSNFAWYRQYLKPGDRYYVQIEPAAFSSFVDKDTLVRRVAHLYLLPSLEASDLAHATVVLSWEDDPAKLHLHYSSQVRLGEQLFFVSRIARGR